MGSEILERRGTQPPSPAAPSRPPTCQGVGLGSRGYSSGCFLPGKHMDAALPGKHMDSAAFARITGAPPYVLRPITRVRFHALDYTNTHHYASAAWACADFAWDTLFQLTVPLLAGSRVTFCRAFHTAGYTWIFGPCWAENQGFRPILGRKPVTSSVDTPLCPWSCWCSQFWHAHSVHNLLIFCTFIQPSNIFQTGTESWAAVSAGTERLESPSQHSPDHRRISHRNGTQTRQAQDRTPPAFDAAWLLRRRQESETERKKDRQRGQR